MKQISTPPEFWGKPVSQPGILWLNAETNYIYIRREGGRLERIESDVYHHEFVFITGGSKKKHK